MRKKFSARAAALGMSGVLLTSALTGCTFGFASDPDDPNAVKEVRWRVRQTSSSPN